jgi:transposase
MAEAGLPVVVNNSRQTRELARATGRLARTNEIDADNVAFLGEAIRPEVRPLPDAGVKTLYALNARCQQLVEMLTAERNRLGTALPPARPSLRGHIRWLEREKEKAESGLQRCIEENLTPRRKFKILCSAKGMGPVTSFALLSKLPELGTVNRKGIAASAGVAPFNRDSGRWRGKRTTWGGRASVRSVLYMAALLASPHNPVIRAYYERLLEAGKAKEVVLAACMRKLPVMLNAMLSRTAPCRTPTTQAARPEYHSSEDSCLGRGLTARVQRAKLRRTSDGRAFST